MKLLRGALLFAAMATTAHAATYVYVSNADDGTIGLYTLESDGTLKPGERFDAGKVAMPMSVTPDKKNLIVALRSKPFQAVTFSINRRSGALKETGRGDLAESFPYIWTEKNGKFLLGASYGANLVSVNPIGRDGTVGKPLQVIPTARNAHSIITDRTNKYVFVPHLGTDQIFQFKFDAKSGRLTANTPPVVQMRSSTGPRHIIMSADNKFAYLLSELVGTITTLALDEKAGTLKETSVASFLAPDSKLVPGAPRGAISGPGTNAPPPRDVTNDIWASDLHLTPNGKFLYAAERTGNQIGAMSVDAATGKLTYLSTTPTEKQPRGFAIDPSGKYMVVTGEKSDTISAYEIGADGALRLLKQYPTGKGSNWVEIVSF